MCIILHSSKVGEISSFPVSQLLSHISMMTSVVCCIIYLDTMADSWTLTVSSECPSHFYRPKPSTSAKSSVTSPSNSSWTRYCPPTDFFSTATNRLGCSSERPRETKRPSKEDTETRSSISHSTKHVAFRKPTGRSLGSRASFEEVNRTTIRRFAPCTQSLVDWQSTWQN